jgi:hypothetical protein
VPTDTDESTLYSGLNSAKTSFKAALDLQRDRIIEGSKADMADGGKAIIDQTTQNRVDDILETGVFAVSGDGIGLRDPYTGQFVPGADGVTPLSIPLQTIIDMGANVSQNSGGSSGGGPLGGGGPLVIDINRGNMKPGMAPKLGRDMLNTDVKTLKP